MAFSMWFFKEVRSSISSSLNSTNKMPCSFFPVVISAAVRPLAGGPSTPMIVQQMNEHEGREIPRMYSQPIQATTVGCKCKVYDQQTKGNIALY